MWGVLVKDNNPTESVHLFACKRFLNVAARIQSKMVYGELGRHPLQISCYIRAIRYWFRLLKLDSERLPIQADRMLMNLDTNSKYIWASSIRSVLQSLDFGYVWLAQGVAEKTVFCACLNKDLQMCSGRTGWQVLILVTVLASIASFSLCLNHRNILTASDKCALEMHSSGLD